MQRVAIQLTVRPGWAAHHLHGREPPAATFGPLCATAAHFAVRLFGPRVDNSIGRKKLGKIAEAFRRFPALRSLASRYYVGGFAPAEESRFIAVGDMSAAAAEQIATSSEDVFWRVGPWEDLILFHGQDLIFRCISHERDATIFGPRELLRQLGYSEMMPANRIDWSILGEPVDDATLSTLTTMLTE